MARRSEHSREELKEMALAAAEKILDEEGLAGLSTRKVAAAMGYTVGTLYLVFRNLDDLILQLNAQRLDDLYEHLFMIRQGNDSPQEVVKTLAHFYIQYAREHPAAWHLLFSFRMPQGQALPGWFEARIARLFALVEEQLGRLGLKLDRQGLKLAASTLWSGVHGVCDLSVGDKLSLSGNTKPEELIDSLIERYISGLVHDTE